MLCRGEREFSWLFHFLSCFFILTLVLLLAIFVPDIRNVFGVVGECVSIRSVCLLFSSMCFCVSAYPFLCDSRFYDLHMFAVCVSWDVLFEKQL